MEDHHVINGKTHYKFINGNFHSYVRGYLIPCNPGQGWSRLLLEDRMFQEIAM
jgi:hypothetical protein